MEKILEVNNVTKLYKNGRGVKNISFSIGKGEIYGFLGPNGAGKSTLMKSITGLNKIQSGSVKILGYDLNKDFEKALGSVGAIIERADLYEYMSAYKNLKIASRFYDNVGDGDIDEMLDIVGLTAYKNEKASNFSLGMKQRLALAGALLGNPKLLILDEPTNGLDIEGTVDMRNLITKLAAEKNISFFISSHLVHDIELICNRIGIISEGVLINDGVETKAIKEKYASLEEFYLEQTRNGGKKDE